jgi:hypothetical protein
MPDVLANSVVDSKIMDLMEDHEEEDGATLLTAASAVVDGLEAWLQEKQPLRNFRQEARAHLDRFIKNRKRSNRKPGQPVLFEYGRLYALGDGRYVMSEKAKLQHLRDAYLVRIEANQIENEDCAADLTYMSSRMRKFKSEQEMLEAVEIRDFGFSAHDEELQVAAD